MNREWRKWIALITPWWKCSKWQGAAGSSGALCSCNSTSSPHRQFKCQLDVRRCRRDVRASRPTGHSPSSLLSALCRSLLTEKAAPVMNIIHSIFSLILKFRAQLIAQPWDSQQGEAVHPSFIAMQQSYNTFKYYSHFLFKGKDSV